jgi:hypothetical protein
MNYYLWFNNFTINRHLKSWKDKTGQTKLKKKYHEQKFKKEIRGTLKKGEGVKFNYIKSIKKISVYDLILKP